MTCALELRQQGQSYPRTCADCGLGPCKKVSAAAMAQDARDAPDSELDAARGVLWRKGDARVLEWVKTTFPAFADKQARAEAEAAVANGAYWAGRPLQSLSRIELIRAVVELGGHVRELNASPRGTR